MWAFWWKDCAKSGDRSRLWSIHLAKQRIKAKRYILIKYQAKSLYRNLALRSQICRDSKADIAPKHFSVYVKRPYTPSPRITQFPLLNVDFSNMYMLVGEFHLSWVIRTIPLIQFLYNAGFARKQNMYKLGNRGWCIKFATGLNVRITTISSHFFANYMNIFHKIEVQMVIFRCWRGPYPNWFKSYDTIAKKHKKAKITKIRKKHYTKNKFLQNWKKNGNSCILCHNFWTN